MLGYSTVLGNKVQIRAQVLILRTWLASIQIVS